MTSTAECKEYLLQQISNRLGQFGQNRRLRKKSALKAMEQYQLSLTYRLCQSENQAPFAIRKESRHPGVIYNTMPRADLFTVVNDQNTYYC